MKVQSECNLPVFDRVWISMYCQFCSIINLSLYSSFQFIQVFILVSQYALVANQLSTVGNHFRIPHTHKRKHSFTEYFWTLVFQNDWPKNVNAKREDIYMSLGKNVGYKKPYRWSNCSWDRYFTIDSIQGYGYMVQG